MPRSFRLNLLLLPLGPLLLAISASGGLQTGHPTIEPLWKEARRPAAKGTRVPVPKEIPKQVSAERPSYSDEPEDICNPKERAKMDAFRVVLNPRTDVKAIILRARNFCDCSPTGNCRFWIFVASGDNYRAILDTHMVQDFGFLKSRSEGYRDLVVWSHNSADRSGARLFQFDGKEYQEVCAWEEDYESKELPNGQWVSAGAPKIVSSSCESLPSSNPPKL